MTDFAAEHERFAYDDAAYVLDALAPADRAAFEQHLATCPTCHQSVAELTGLPAVLERADPLALETLDVEPMPETLLPRLLAEVGQHRRRRSVRVAAVGFLAACLLAALAFGGIAVWSDSHRPQTLVMQPVGPDSDGIHATVRLLGDNADPRIRLDCGYDGTGQEYPGYQPSFRMVVFNRAGLQRDLGNWSPQPGEDVEIVRDSPWRRQVLSKIEISDSTGHVLLRLSL